MLAVKYNVYNTYKTLHLFSQKQLSVAIKNKYFECENYDKTAESRGTDPACDRLEERSKCWSHTDIRKEFEEHWFQRWDDALKMFYQTYQKYNTELERIYIQGKDTYPSISFSDRFSYSIPGLHFFKCSNDKSFVTF